MDNSRFRLFGQHDTSADVARAQTDDGRKNSCKVQFSGEFSPVPSRSEADIEEICVFLHGPPFVAAPAAQVIDLT